MQFIIYIDNPGARKLPRPLLFRSALVHFLKQYIVLGAVATEEGGVHLISCTNRDKFVSERGWHDNKTR